MAAVDADGFGGVFDADSGSSLLSANHILDEVINDIGLADS